ncbi:hypothetical protein DBR06_SOUSAS1210127, partial [Sousa chinensis]
IDNFMKITNSLTELHNLKKKKRKKETRKAK